MIYGIRIRMYAHTFYNILFRIPFNSILWSSPYAVSLTHSPSVRAGCDVGCQLRLKLEDAFVVSRILIALSASP
jgi:hypothetical protein